MFYFTIGAGKKPRLEGNYMLYTLVLTVVAIVLGYRAAQTWNPLKRLRLMEFEVAFWMMSAIFNVCDGNLHLVALKFVAIVLVLRALETTRLVLTLRGY